MNINKPKKNFGHIIESAKQLPKIAMGALLGMAIGLGMNIGNASAFQAENNKKIENTPQEQVVAGLTDTIYQGNEACTTTPNKIDESNAIPLDLDHISPEGVKKLLKNFCDPEKISAEVLKEKQIARVQIKFDEFANDVFFEVFKNKAKQFNDLDQNSAKQYLEQEMLDYFIAMKEGRMGTFRFCAEALLPTDLEKNFGMDMIKNMIAASAESIVDAQKTQTLKQLEARLNKTSEVDTPDNSCYPGTSREQVLSNFIQGDTRTSEQIEADDKVAQTIDRETIVDDGYQITDLIALANTQGINLHSTNPNKSQLVPVSNPKSNLMVKFLPNSNQQVKQTNNQAAILYNFLKLPIGQTILKKYQSVSDKNQNLNIRLTFAVGPTSKIQKGGINGTVLLNQKPNSRGTNIAVLQDVVMDPEYFCLETILNETVESYFNAYFTSKGFTGQYDPKSRSYNHKFIDPKNNDAHEISPLYVFTQPFQELNWLITDQIGQAERRAILKNKLKGNVNFSLSQTPNEYWKEVVAEMGKKSVQELIDDLNRQVNVIYGEYPNPLNKHYDYPIIEQFWTDLVGIYGETIPQFKEIGMAIDPNTGKYVFYNLEKPVDGSVIAKKKPTHVGSTTYAFEPVKIPESWKNWK